MKDKISNNFFCPLPWTHRHIDTLGNIKACCMSEEPNHFGSERHISRFASENEVGFSSHILKLRTDFKEGKVPSACFGCFKMEQIGIESARMRAIKQLGVDKISEDFCAVTKTLDLRFGNQCNLKCVMCSPFASKAWLSDWNAVSSDPLTPDVEKNLKDLRWYSESKLWKYLETLLPQIEHLHFAGGEPFLSPEVMRTLDLCVRLGISKQISLSFSTNLTLLPENFKKIWAHFKNVRLRVSLDGVGKINYFIRYPSRWENVNKLLHQLDGAFQDWNVFKIEIWTTVQLYNVFHLRELYLYLKQFQFVDRYPFLSPLTWPSFFSIQQLNLMQKKQVEKELKSLCDDLIDIPHEGLRNPLQLIRFMNYAASKRALHHEFRKVTKKIEEINKTRCLDLNPQLTPQLSSRVFKGIWDAVF
jgi:MoaA/NifB/PqqE/SkfB family radical SAM enzyme